MIDPTGEVGQGAGPRAGREETKCEGGCGSVSRELGVSGCGRIRRGTIGFACGSRGGVKKPPLGEGGDDEVEAVAGWHLQMSRLHHRVA